MKYINYLCGVELYKVMYIRLCYYKSVHVLIHTTN